MSFTFHIPAEASHRIPVPQVLEGLYPESLRVREPLDRQGDWPSGSLNLYLHRQSVRAVNVCRDEEGIHVRLLACSNKADHQFCLALVMRFAVVLNSPIEPQIGDDTSVDSFQETFDSRWIAQSMLPGPITLITLIERRNTTFTVPCAVRSYHLGPQHLQRLRSAGPASELSHRLLEDMRRVQSFDEIQYALLDSFKASVQSGSYTVAILNPYERCLVPHVDRLALATDDGVFMIAADLLPTLTDVTFVDEYQVLVGPMLGAAWDDLIARAMPHKLDADSAV